MIHAAVLLNRKGRCLAAIAGNIMKDAITQQPAIGKVIHALAAIIRKAVHAAVEVMGQNPEVVIW